jgi:hypothetical protein
MIAKRTMCQQAVRPSGRESCPRRSRHAVTPDAPNTVDFLQ